jgi:hypothetical protein
VEYELPECIELDSREGQFDDIEDAQHHFAATGIGFNLGKVSI